MTIATRPDSMSAARNVGHLLRQTAETFEERGVRDPCRWAETLLAAVLNVPTAALEQYAGDVLTPWQWERYQEWMGEASADAPVAYLVGRAPFLGRDFEVTRDTLIPKTDTELFLRIVFEEAAHDPLPANPHLLELCAGSGCVAVSLALQYPGSTVVATDISLEALAVARRNVSRHAVDGRVRLGLGDLWEPVAPLANARPFDLIVSNPPYIPTERIPEMGRHVAEHEPHLALDGGDDGLDPHRRILEAAADYLAPGGRVLLEHEWYHGEVARKLAEQFADRYEDIRTVADANGKDRALHVRRRA